MNQILVDRQTFFQLVEQYLTAEIEILQLHSVAPNQSLKHNLDISQRMNELDYLRDEFRKCETPEDYAVCFVKLKSVLDRRQKTAAEE